MLEFYVSEMNAAANNKKNNSAFSSTVAVADDIIGQNQSKHEELHQLNQSLQTQTQASIPTYQIVLNE